MYFRYKQIVLILTIGIGIGVLIPMITMQFSSHALEESSTEQLELMNKVSSLNEIDSIPTNDLREQSPQQKKLYARIQEGTLSIYENDPLTGNVVLSGIKVSYWTKDMQALVTRIEFHSLDEVQSFIDSMSEELWIE